ncbi:uncharacterized protein LOC119584408 isoform X1 [Penaeus monodon]|uniref:uncharacterized protein LOC119584408 isoform X1 n=1 Tax=Penaeus monodon TaxID=6687 RepID=UPI0018A6FC09|nr:uncharacterized protein LOC119584408 isoform X1 [Penaeus monodon]
MASTGLGRVLCCISRSRVQRAILYVDRATPNQHHLLHNETLAARSHTQKNFRKPLSGPLHQPLRNQAHRRITDWNQKRSGIGHSRLHIVIINLSLGVFMIYFMWLREPNDIDEYMNRPIWERLPGIDPERAEQMMEMDRRLGLQVDTTGLEKYKKEYYAQQAEKFEKEQQAERRHRELRAASRNHFNMLQKRAQKEDEE